MTLSMLVWFGAHLHVGARWNLLHRAKLEEKIQLTPYKVNCTKPRLTHIRYMDIAWYLIQELKRHEPV